MGWAWEQSPSLLPPSFGQNSDVSCKGTWEVLCTSVPRRERQIVWWTTSQSLPCETLVCVSSHLL